MGPPTGTLIYGSNNNVKAAPINMTDALMRLYGSSGQDATVAAQTLKARHDLTVEQWSVMEEMAKMLGRAPGERPKTVWEQLMGHIQKFNAEPGVCHAMVALFMNRLLHNRASIEDAWPTEAETEWLAQKLARVQKEFQLESMKLVVDSPNLNRAAVVKKATNRVMKSGPAELRFELRFQVLMEDHATTAAAMPWDAILKKVREFNICLLTAYIRQQGHALALAGQNGKWYLLDPNYGLYRYGVSSQLRDDLKRLLAEYKMTGYGFFAPKVVG